MYLWSYHPDKEMQSVLRRGKPSLPFWTLERSELLLETHSGIFSLNLPLAQVTDSKWDAASHHPAEALWFSICVTGKERRTPELRTLDGTSKESSDRQTQSRHRVPHEGCSFANMPDCTGSKSAFLRLSFWSGLPELSEFMLFRFICMCGWICGAAAGNKPASNLQPASSDISQLEIRRLTESGGMHHSGTKKCFDSTNKQAMSNYSESSKQQPEIEVRGPSIQSELSVNLIFMQVSRHLSCLPSNFVPFPGCNYAHDYSAERNSGIWTLTEALNSSATTASLYFHDCFIQPRFRAAVILSGLSEGDISDRTNTNTHKHTLASQLQEMLPCVCFWEETRKK